MKIVHFPHPALMKPSNPVTQFDSAVVDTHSEINHATNTSHDIEGDLARIAREMISIMHQASGVGLAANQVALDKRIFVMQCTSAKPPYAFINPEIIAMSNIDKKDSEGCLSFPGLNIDVERKDWVELRWNDAAGNFLEEKFFGLEAVCIQHEIDHLNGINFVDRLGSVKKMMSLKKYLSPKNKKHNP